MRKGRRKIRWSRVLLLLLIVSALITAVAVGAMYAWHSFNGKSGAPTIEKESTAVSLGDDKLGKRVNILLLGIDDGEDQGQGRRSDTIIVLSISPEDGNINLLSIPRDTKVAIPGRPGFDKITHAYAYGGTGLAIRTVQDFLKIPIHYHVTVDWPGFIKVIDLLGGVDVYVEHDMHYQDPYANLNIQLVKGYQHLNGNEAGQYVRFRHDELGDIGRVQRQQRLLKALTDQMFQFGTILKLPALYSTLQQYVQTDMNIFTMAKIANSVASSQAKLLKTEMLPGDFATIEGKSYWVPDNEQTQRVVERMFLSQPAPVSGMTAQQSY